MNDHLPLRAVGILGGAALMIAMATDLLSVIGRHVGMPLLGSIEIVRAAVVLSAAAGIVVATAAGTHAVVHLLIDRLGPGPRAWLVRFNRLASALFMLSLAVGSVWISADLWNGSEESELLGIPFAPLRIFMILCVLGTAGMFAVQAARSRR